MELATKITPAAIRSGVNKTDFFPLRIFLLSCSTSLDKSFEEIFSIPSNASARKGSLNAFFSSECISLEPSSPFLYLIISFWRSSILFHANFQISFSVLNKAFDLVHIKTGDRNNVFVAFFFQVEQSNTLLLAVNKFIDAIFHLLQVPLQGFIYSLMQ